MSIMFDHPQVSRLNTEALGVARKKQAEREGRARFLSAEVDLLCDTVLAKAISTDWRSPAPSIVITWTDASSDAGEENYAAWPLGNDIYLTFYGLRDGTGRPVQLQPDVLVVARSALRALLSS